MDKKTEKELLNIVCKNYEKIAEGFSKTREKKLWPELIKLLKEVKSGDKILDVGCGNGRLIKAFEDKKVDYLGVELSPKLIEFARKNNPKHKFVVGDMLNLRSFSEYDFDYVTSIAVLHHVPGKRLQIDALRQIRNKIKNDGKIILTVWNLWENKKYKKMIFKFFLLKLFKKHKMDFGDIVFDWRKNKDEFLSPRYYHAFRKSELKNIVKKSGLKIEKMYKDKYNYYLVLRK